MNGEVDNGFSILRTTLESAFEVPLSVTITSAHAGDGKTEVAVGIARAFSIAGYRTILIDANPKNPSVGAALGIGRLRAPLALDEASALSAIQVTPFLDAASIADMALMDSSSASTLRAFMDDLRGRYAVTIWDASDAFSTSVALQCAAASEGTLVAVRYGRNPTPEDHRLVATLEQVGARIVGVVPTEFPGDRKQKRGAKPEPRTIEGDVPAAGVRRAGKSTA
jgi:receptor protein-tyrosine kinase